MLGLRLGLVLISGTTAWQLKSPLHATPARSHTRSVSSPRLATAGEDSEEVWSEVDKLDDLVIIDVCGLMYKTYT
jgi:hypothetical protein